MAESLRGSLGRMSRHVGSPPLAAQIRDVAEVINTPFRFVQDALRFPNSERRCERRLQESLERRPNVTDQAKSATRRAALLVGRTASSHSGPLSASVDRVLLRSFLRV